jgi:hypothetical protein
MNFEKSIIRKNELLFFVPFFLVSVLTGKLVSLSSNKQSNFLNIAIIGLEWLFYIMLVVALLYGIYKLIKKEYTLEKVWLFSGIFILLQFAGVYQFEISLKYYSMELNNVIFHDIMVSDIFLVLYVTFLLYYLVKSKNSKSKNSLTKLNIMVLFLLLLLPFLRSINSYIYRDILVEWMKNKRLTIITSRFFTEDMSLSEKMDKADKIMDQLTMGNTYIESFYPKFIYGAICVGAIALFREKITWQKYLALGGTFIIVQYFGITYFDKLLRCFNSSFQSGTIMMFYEIVLKYSYAIFYIIPLALYSFKKIYYGFAVPKVE